MTLLKACRKHIPAYRSWTINLESALFKSTSVEPAEYIEMNRQKFSTLTFD